MTDPPNPRAPTPPAELTALPRVRCPARPHAAVLPELWCAQRARRRGWRPARARASSRCRWCCWHSGLASSPWRFRRPADREDHDRHASRYRHRTVPDRGPRVPAPASGHRSASDGDGHHADHTTTTTRRNHDHPDRHRRRRRRPTTSTPTRRPRRPASWPAGTSAWTVVLASATSQSSADPIAARASADGLRPACSTAGPTRP